MKTFHKPLPILSLFALLLLVVWACRKEKPEFDLSDKDPCSCASEVSADFDIFNAIYIYYQQTWLRSYTDTSFAGTVSFEAKDLTADEYKWYIGSQVFETSGVSRNFGTQWKGFDIPITLVVRKTPNNVCFPNDDGYDSITKVFHISEFPIVEEMEDPANSSFHQIQYGSIEGTYRLIAPHLSDSIDMHIDVVSRHGAGNVPQVDIQNIDGQGTSCTSIGRFLDNGTYRLIIFGFDGGTDPINSCNNWGGFISNPVHGSAEITLRHKYYADGNLNALTENWYYYKGRKLN